jgi:hypothetical protein
MIPLEPLKVRRIENFDGKKSACRGVFVKNDAMNLHVVIQRIDPHHRARLCNIKGLFSIALVR